MNRRQMRKGFGWLVLIAVLGFGALTAPAANQYWDTGTGAGYQAGTGVWSTLANYWAPPTNAPTAWVDNNDAFFTVAATAVVETVSANSLAIQNSAIVLMGSGLLTLGAGGVSNTISGTKIYVPITLSADQVWYGSNPYRVEAKIDGAAYALTVNQTAAGALTWSIYRPIGDRFS